jgi:hypothetical protein
MDIDAALERAGHLPDGPRPEIAERHRRALRHAITTAPGATSPGSRIGTDFTGDEVVTVPLRPLAPGRRRRAVTVALAAAALVTAAVVPVAWWARTNAAPAGGTPVEATTLASTLPSSSLPVVPPVADATTTTATTEAVEVIVPMCGPDFPIEYEVRSDLTPEEGPLPDFPPTTGGQLIHHWVGEDMSIELRWPADPKPLEGGGTDPGGTLEISKSGRAVDDDSETPAPPYEFAVFDSRQQTNPPDEPVVSEPELRITSVPTEAPSPECTIMQFRAVTPDGDQVTNAFPVTDPWQWIDLNPLLSNRITVDEAPTEAVLCEGGGSPDVPDNEYGVIDEPVPYPSPTAALGAFLSTPEARGTAKSGYVEMIAADGTITYGKPLEGGPGYVTLVEVDPLGDGTWAVVSWTASGC